MNSQTIVMCVVALILGMLLAHMLKDVCGCNKVLEGACEPVGDCVAYVDNFAISSPRPTCERKCRAGERFYRRYPIYPS